MKKNTYLLIFIFHLFSISLYAQDADSIDLFDLTLEQLMNTEIDVGSNVIKDVKKQPISVTTISQTQLHLSGARTLIDAITLYVPGFFSVEDQDDVIAGTRGLAPDNNSKIMLLVNGQILNTEFFWGPPSAILNSTYFDYIEKIEVIRGPGSVILGQGALLGVINIITKDAQYYDQKIGGTVSATGGLNGYYGAHADVGISADNKSIFIDLGIENYDGQALRKEGWAADQVNSGYTGGVVGDIGTRLKKSQNNLALVRARYNKLGVQFMLADQTKDLYNFYRDRNVFSQTLATVMLDYKTDLSDKISMKAVLDGSSDDFALASVDGYTMGGMHENRFGGHLLFNFNELIPNNRMAIGTEFRYFAMGGNNRNGDNFIANVVNTTISQTDFIADANANKTWGYATTIPVYSAFVEDFHSLGKLDLFGALRYDNHPYWGTNISPRIGIIVSPTNDLTLRLSYQEGFRGAAGVHYSGGYRQDGLLSERNFAHVEDDPIYFMDGLNQNFATASGDSAQVWVKGTGYNKNIPATRPEKMKSFELTVDYDFAPKFNLYAVGFYNVLQNVIDVGVIWAPGYYFEEGTEYIAANVQPYSVPAIGDELPGDWNGYWFFKNSDGAIHQGGFEISVSYRSKNLLASVNHSFVKLIQADEQQLSSMYLTPKGNFKAFPENVTRVNITTNLTPKISSGINYLYYYSWYSPSDQQVKSNHLLNLSVDFQLIKNLNLTLSSLNVFNQKKLYPMNSNAGGQDLSDGAPAVETTSLWLKVGYRF